MRALDVPPNPQWVAQRIVRLLSHYYVVDLHPAVMESIANDWTRELAGFPDWAVDAACSWWVSRHNRKRSSKPLPGDISERAQNEAAILKLGRKQVEAFDRFGNSPPAYLRA